MSNGIALFLGMDNSLEENLAYLELARANGFSHLFTSLHIPEADYAQLGNEFRQLMSSANKLGFYSIADISPNAYDYLGLTRDNLPSLAKLGINALRMDYGFSAAEIARYSKNQAGLRIDLNASSLTANFWHEIIAAGAELTNLSACHNYYPRRNTGLSRASLQAKNQLLRDYAIPISAFVALPKQRRGPLHEGLPSLEFTRELSPATAIQILLHNAIDHVFIGDAQASTEELIACRNLQRDIVMLELATNSPLALNYSELLNLVHTNRPDAASQVIRSQESRLMLLNNQTRTAEYIAPNNCIERKRGSVTIDNSNYLRYAGELQICKENLPADPCVNVIAELSAESCLLLDYVGDNQCFAFYFKSLSCT